MGCGDDLHEYAYVSIVDHVHVVVLVFGVFPPVEVVIPVLYGDLFANAEAPI